MDFLNMNALWIASAAFAILMVILAVVGVIAVFVGRYRPTLAQAAAAEQTLLVRRQELADVEEKIRVEQARYAEAEKKASEVAWLEERLGNLNAEINTLEPRRAEILEVQQRLEEIAAEYGDTTREATRAKHELEGLQAEIERGRRLQADGEAMEKRIIELRDELQDLQTDRDEAVHARRQLAELKEGLEEHRIEIGRKEATLKALGERENETLEQLGATVEELSKLEQKLGTLKEELAELRQEKIALADVSQQVETLRDRRASLEAHNAELERRIQEMGGEVAGGTKADALEDIKEMPSALEPLLAAPYSPSSNEERTEGAYLRRAKGAIEAAGLRYHDRIIRAFHTALKIAQEAPMTVLSGISGTGKTQLPRRYAEGMGIGFLPMPVQPRWDSPQDLLGFYNFIEKKYKATELARAMWQLNGLGDEAHKAMLEDRMLLVLLDEMNLARVEYYFAEFLSRLEMRPSPQEAGDRRKRRNAEILIEVPGQAPIHLFPGHNLLFTGTMNEDESTQALSDKVLDRGNMLRFPAPKKLYEAQASSSATTSILPISRSVWASWRKDMSSLADVNGAKAMVSELADIMKELERPFGHRVGQAMLAYAANYPSHDGQHGTLLLDAMSDQVEMRLLPKLRGLELDTARDGLGKLAEHVKDKLKDDALAEAIDESVEASEDAGRFAWKGLTR
jgi:hypothetical protein